MEWVYLVIVLCLGSLLSTVIWLAGKNGRKLAQLEALKAEIKKQAKEQERAQKIRDHVYHLSTGDIRCRLHDVANQQH